MPHQPLISIVVPTLNEAENVDPLLTAILKQAGPNLDLEVLVADGGSTDGTVERVLAWQDDAPVRLVSGGGAGGLAGDVLAAAKEAAGDIVVVIDADFSHPPEKIPELVQPIIAGTADMAVGSRYVPGGGTPGWPLARRVLSRLGCALAWPLTELRDPMSGFFAVRRPMLLAVDPEAAGFKIGLEVIAKSGNSLRLTEVPIVFWDRVRGDSKIGWVHMLAYARRLMVLAGGAISLGNATRFAAVGLIGLLVDLALFQLLFAAGYGLLPAHITSFAAATVSNYLLNSRWAFAASAAAGESDWRRYLRFLTVCLMALTLRGGVLAIAVELLGWPPQLAILLGVAVAAGVNFFGSAFFVFPSVSPRVSPSTRWRIAALGVLGYLVTLRLMFLCLPNLIPEEAYYWNYAQHLDIGYLDHPPMVAWLIWLGTAVFGHTEFGVRIAAFLVWLGAAFFSFRYARDLYGKSAALVTVLLVAALPFFFFTGLLMTPDAPLTAAWAGALYFLQQALLRDRRAAWWGVGLCAGLGMLSKYTIALLGPATLVFLLLDKRARRWLLRPEPYLAVAIGAVLFSPVVYWNATHDWASFAFQGTRRLAGSYQFALHELVGAASVLLTPIGLAAAVLALLSIRSSVTGATATASEADRRNLFIAVYTIVPLSVFTAFSLFHAVKLNWTGPLWLAVLPTIAAMILRSEDLTRAYSLVRRAWTPTIAVMLVGYGLGLHYLVFGLPGGQYVGNMRLLPIAWKEMGLLASAIEKGVEHATGRQVFLAGTDRYFLSSELAFYNRTDSDSVRTTAGRGLFGNTSLMYDYWFDPEQMRGQNVILISLEKKGLQTNAIRSHFVRLDDINEQAVLKRGIVVGRFFYRVGYDFQPRRKAESHPTVMARDSD